MRSINPSAKSGGPSPSGTHRRVSYPSYPPLPPDMQKKEVARVRMLILKGKVDDLCAEGRAALPFIGDLLRTEEDMGVLAATAEAMLKITEGRMRVADEVLCHLVLGNDGRIFDMGFSGVQSLVQALKNKEMPLLRVAMVECIGRYCILEVAQRHCGPVPEGFQKKHAGFVMLSIVRPLEDILADPGEPSRVRISAAFALADAVSACNQFVSVRVADRLRDASQNDADEEVKRFADDAYLIAAPPARPGSFDDNPTVPLSRKPGR